MSKKYSYEFKLNLVQDYLNGTLGYTLLTKKHAISDSDLIGKWVNQYKTFGKDGLKRKKTNNVIIIDPTLEANAVEKYSFCF